MERKGFTRHGRKVAVAAATLGIMVAATGVTTPAAAAATRWTMPGVTDEVLQDAIDTVTEAAGAENVTFDLVDAQFNQVIYNYTNWLVCAQSPKEDRTVAIKAAPQTVIFYLRRPAAGC